MGQQHKTVHVKVGDQEADIDVKLAPLIRLMWKAGILTEQCCQEWWPGLARIIFPFTGDVMEFLDIAQRHYKVEVETWDEGWMEDDKKQSIIVQLYVAFPTKDIPYLVKAWTAHLAESARKPACTAAGPEGQATSYWGAVSLTPRSSASAGSGSERAP